MCGPSLGGARTPSAGTRTGSILPCGACSQILHPESQHLPDLLIPIFASPAQTEVALLIPPPSLWRDLADSVSTL